MVHRLDTGEVILPVLGVLWLVNGCVANLGSLGSINFSCETRFLTLSPQKAAGLRGRVGV